MKKILIENKYPVSLIKRKGSKSIRLTYSAINGLRVTFPVWITYGYAIKFVNSKIDFIKKNYTEYRGISNNLEIASTYTVKFIRSDSENLYHKITSNQLLIYVPEKYDIYHSEVQEYVKRISLKILRDEAEYYLPKRLKYLANLHGFEVEKINIRVLKSRWGSCDSKKNITLNLYLMQLPTHIIDYVLIHELVHTINMSHNSMFWNKVGIFIPNYKEIKKELRLRQPIFSSSL